MSVLSAPANDMTLPKKVSTITVSHLMCGGYVFAVDGKPVTDAQMARVCVAIVEAIRDQQA